jgi:hypothetical protein
VAPAGAQQPSWLAALGGAAPMGAPAPEFTPVDKADFVSLVTDQAAQDQTALLSAAFATGDKPFVEPPSTKGIPSAVDRYLDRLLTS